MAALLKGFLGWLMNLVLGLFSWVFALVGIMPEGTDVQPPAILVYAWEIGNYWVPLDLVVACGLALIGLRLTLTLVKTIKRFIPTMGA